MALLVKGYFQNCFRRFFDTKKILVSSKIYIQKSCLEGTHTHIHIYYVGEYVATLFTLYLVLTTDSVNLTINRVIPTGVWLIKMCSTERPYNIYIYIVNSSTLLYSLSFVFVNFHLRSKD